MSEDGGDAEEAPHNNEIAIIIDKYRRGRQGGAVIDEWEEVTFEASCTDRFGFVHKTALPAVQDAEELLQKQRETKRADKWLKMISRWDKVWGTQRFVDRVYKGLPDKMRGTVWSRLLVLPTEASKVYSEMLSYATSPFTYSPDIRQIDLDINRTYRDHYMFRERYNPGQLALFNVLVAYSVYNTEIGYCQGMSQIAALLLMYFREEEAFWGLDALLTNERFAMHGFFIPGFPKLLRFQQHHNLVMEKFLPKLKKHLDRQGVETGIYTLKWFFQCFLDRIPFSLTLRVWDVFLLEGDRILTCMAYTILKLHRKYLLKKHMDDILKYLQIELASDFRYKDDKAMNELREAIEELRRVGLDTPGRPPPEELPKRRLGELPPPQPMPERAKFPPVLVNGAAAKDATRERGNSISAESFSQSNEDSRSLTATSVTSATSTAEVSRHENNWSLLFSRGGSHRSLSELSRHDANVVRIHVPYDGQRPNILNLNAVRIDVHDEQTPCFDRDRTPVAEFEIIKKCEFAEGSKAS